MVYGSIGDIKIIRKKMDKIFTGKRMLSPIYMARCSKCRWEGRELGLERATPHSKFHKCPGCGGVKMPTRLGQDYRRSCLTYYAIEG